MKAYDSNAELLLIKTICDTQFKSFILSKIDQEYFGSDAAKEIYGRIKILIGNNKPIPSSDVLKFDEVLTEPSRALLSTNVKPLGTEDDVNATLDIIQKYRKSRILLNTITQAIEVLKNQDPNIDEVVTAMTSALQKCHTGQDASEMFHIGSEFEEQLDKSVESLLTGDVGDLLPTGFAEFDRRTGGFRRKKVFVMASVPGGGKSAMAEQMAINQYMMGYNVCYVSYEMDEEEHMYRILSNISKVNHAELSLKRTSLKQKELIRKKWKEFLKGHGGTNKYTVWCPKRELDMNDIAIELAPYNYDAIYVDYINLLKQSPKKALWETLGEHSRSAKLAANKLNCLMCLLAQLDDETAKLKYAKSIIANSDNVWIWENNTKEKESGIIEVKQFKARGSEPYNFLLSRDFSIMKFSDYFGPAPVDIAPEQKKYPPKMSELK